MVSGMAYGDSVRQECDGLRAVLRRVVCGAACVWPLW